MQKIDMIRYLLMKFNTNKLNKITHNIIKMSVDEILFYLLLQLLGKKIFHNFIRGLNSIFREIASRGHKWQLLIEWNKPPRPEWFNHFEDLYFQWRAKRNPLWVERGCFNLLAINSGSNLLELCCGDGFNSYYFYSIRARKIIAVDFSREAIAHAKKYNQADNVKYIKGDIRKSLPAGRFNNIVWDAAIEHFTAKEIRSLLMKIKGKLSNGGILSGYTITENPNGKQHELHEYEFRSKEELAKMLGLYFNNVKVFETDYPSRKNLHFFASDKTIPFDRTWEWSVSIHKK